MAWPKLLPVLLIALFGLAATLVAERLTLDTMKRIVRKRFPSVAQLSTAKLQAWLRDPTRPHPLLLDVRTEAEFKMSHLPDASWIDPSSKPADVLQHLPADRAIVTYCSVGYRSSEMAKKLMKAGVKTVYNLEGSIFQWANENRPLVNTEGPATKVHPYNATFGRLLNPEKRG